MAITNQHVEQVICNYVDRYVETNSAARLIRDELNETGVGLRPLLDHLSLRTADVQERCLEFEALGFSFDDRLGVIERDSWWAKVYRKPGFPAVYIAQAHADERGEDSDIPGWVERFTDGYLHHIGIRVGELENAIERLREKDVRFNDDICGERGGSFRQIYTLPEIVDGREFTVLELVERRWGYMGFLAPPVRHTQRSKSLGA